MSDLFQDNVPDDFIIEVFRVMNKANLHRFHVLTNRAERLPEISSRLAWSENIWMGVSVENEDYVSRINCLRRTKARVRFLSLEPLLGPLRRLDLKSIDWVIVGGESGPKARAMNPEWVTDIREQCKKARVPFFFKQWGGKNKKVTGRILEGRTWDEMPAVLN
jgi:protein gp37